MKLALALILGAAGSLAACADPYAPPPPGAPAYAVPVAAVVPAGACFRTHEIRNHTLGDDHTIYLNVAGREVYRVGVRGACLAGATSSDPLVMRQPPGTAIVCRPIDLDIGVNKSGFESSCIVDSIARLTPAEIDALPPRLRP